jgi:hypothetical protein
MARHRLQLNADLVLLIKAVSTIERIGRTLDPDFKIVERATPHVEQLLADKRRPRAVARRAADTSLEMFKALSSLRPSPPSPSRSGATVCRSSSCITISTSSFVNGPIEQPLSFAIVIAAIVIASSIMVHADGPDDARLSMLGLIGFLAVFRGWPGDWHPAIKDACSVLRENQAALRHHAGIGAPSDRACRQRATGDRRERGGQAGRCAARLTILLAR